MFEKKQAEVLVVGAGPVGLFAAAELKRRGVDVYVADAESGGTGMSYALALHPDSVDLLDRLDLGAGVTEAAYRVERVAFYEGPERRAVFDLAALGGRYPFLSILPQSALEGSLQRWLEKHKVKIHWQHRVASIRPKAEGVEADVERWGVDSVGYAFAHDERVVEKVFPFRARYLLGTDGHRSLVRRFLDVDYESLAEPALFAVFEFETGYDAAQEARVILDEGTTNVLWPLPGGRCRWSFQLTDIQEFSGERVKSRLSSLGRWLLPTLTRDRMEALIAERAPWFEAGLGDVLWSVAIRFERRLATAFGGGRLWLAGDSAHLASPVGMHSMNVGLREAADLAERFEGILHRDRPEAILEEYNRERRAEWKTLLGVDGGARPTGAADPFVARNAERLLSSAPASGEALDRLLGQVGLRLG
jgi:2-polyprenyl-6-methoxyphenol hydroxylase-like FAD-dependent oxidoreductase